MAKKVNILPSTKCINCANAGEPIGNPAVIQCSFYDRILVANSIRKCKVYSDKKTNDA